MNPSADAFALLFFLDGAGIPCAMVPGAQLCDNCRRQLSQPPPTVPARVPMNAESLFPGSIAPVLSASTAVARANNPLAFIPIHPLKQPTSSADFANHFLAADATLRSRFRSNLTPSHGSLVL